MPIYEYQCPKCQNIFEEWVKTAGAGDMRPCPRCGEAAEHIISNTAFVLKGGGWYVTDYGYRKGVSENGSGDAPAKNEGTPAEKNGSTAEAGTSKSETAPSPAAAAADSTPTAPAPAKSSAASESA